MSPLDLADRQLWPDGVSVVEPAKVADLLFQGVPAARIAVSEITPEIEHFNRYSQVSLGVKTSYDASIFPPKWSLPEAINKLDLDEHLVGLVDRIERDHLYEARVERLAQEILLYKELKLEQVLRVLIYVIETMTEQDIVWGVGRGSSCSSYLLFLLGLHEVDCVKYQVEVSDFLHQSQETPHHA